MTLRTPPHEKRGTFSWHFHQIHWLCIRGTVHVRHQVGCHRTSWTFLAEEISRWGVIANDATRRSTNIHMGRVPVCHRLPHLHFSMVFVAEDVKYFGWPWRWGCHTASLKSPSWSFVQGHWFSARPFEVARLVSPNIQGVSPCSSDVNINRFRRTGKQLACGY